MTDQEKAKLRNQMHFFRSGYVTGEAAMLPDAIDDAVEHLLNELTGEQLCLMTVEQVTVTPVVLPAYTEADPHRYQYIVTILAKPLKGQYPRDVPRSRRMRRVYDAMQKPEGEVDDVDNS